MTDEGKSDIGFNTALRLFLFFLLTAIPCMIVFWMLLYAFYVDGTIRLNAFLLSGGCFLVGSALLAFSGASRERVILWLLGFVIAVGISVLNGIIYLTAVAMVYPVETFVISLILIALGVYLYLQYMSRKQPAAPTAVTKAMDVFSLSRKPFSKEVLIGGVELVQLPEEHLSQSSELLNYRPFLDLLRALTLANIPLALRLERIRHKTRVFYLTWAKEERTLREYIVRMEDNLRGNLSGMKFKILLQFEGIKLAENQCAVALYLQGEPLSIEDESQKSDALTVMASVLQKLPNGVIQISATPQTTNRRKLKNLEDKYKAEIARSQCVVSTPRSTLFSGEVQESTTQVNPEAQRKAASLAVQIERLSTNHLCEVRVAAICWDTEKTIAEESSKRLMTTLRGNLAPADKNRSLTLETKSNISEVTQVLRGEPVGQTTLLSINEAAIFFVIPTCDLGIPVADHATFTSNPATLNPPDVSKPQIAESTKPSLSLGKILDESGREIGEFKIFIEDLASHSGIYGDIGSGKSTTQICITHELRKNGINTLEVLSSKNEDYLRTIRADKNIRVITLGDETISTARFSLTNMIDGVHVNQIINGIKTLFVAAKPTDGIIKEYLEKVIELTFKRLGWARETNTRGIPIVLQDFIETLPLIESELQYSSRGNEDFRGALFGRFTSVCEGVLRSIFGTITGMSIEELVSKPTIILLDKLSVEERSFFMFWLVNSLALHFEAKKKTDGTSKVGLKYYVVLEEAHRFLKRGSNINVEEAHGAHRIALDTICVTMTESRSSGLGFGLATPSAIELATAAFKMPLNIFFQKTNSRDDRQLIGHQINCNEDQITMIGSLQKGVAVVRTASSAKPILVRINNPLELYPELNPKSPVTDEEIKKHMEPVRDANPHFNAKSEFTTRVPRIQDLSIEYSSMTIDMPSIFRLYAILSIPLFRKVCKELSKMDLSRSSLLVAMLVRDIAGAAAYNSDALPFCYQHLIWSFSKFISPWVRENNEEVITDLAELLSIDRAVLSLNMDLLNERVKKGVIGKKIPAYLEPVKMKSLLLEAIRSATSEHKELKRKEPARVQETPVVNNKSLELIDSIVRTKDFALRYSERLTKAEEGDIGPLLRLLEAFYCNLNGTSGSITDVLSLLLARARVIHEEPVDETLWATINDAIITRIAEQGSESAA